jgi:flagellar biosynthesis anti-sigma factor FlgM
MGNNGQAPTWSNTMKIDGNRPAHDTQAADGPRRTEKDAGVRPGAGAAAPAGDRVELSGDAALRTAALKAAMDAPAIRTDLVDRLRDRLNAGQVGTDSHKLAEAIIDDLLK